VQGPSIPQDDDMISIYYLKATINAMCAKLKRLEQHTSQRFDAQLATIDSMRRGLDEQHGTLAQFRDSVRLLSGAARLMSGFQEQHRGSDAGADAGVVMPVLAAECHDRLANLQESHMQAMYDREVHPLGTAARKDATHAHVCNDLLAHQYVHGLQLKAMQMQIRELQDSLQTSACCSTGSCEWPRAIASAIPEVGGAAAPHRIPRLVSDGSPPVAERSLTRPSADEGYAVSCRGSTGPRSGRAILQPAGTVHAAEQHPASPLHEGLSPLHCQGTAVAHAAAHAAAHAVYGGDRAAESACAPKAKAGHLAEIVASRLSPFDIGSMVGAEEAAARGAAARAASPDWVLQQKAQLEAKVSHVQRSLPERTWNARRQAYAAEQISANGRMGNPCIALSQVNTIPRYA